MFWIIYIVIDKLWFLITIIDIIIFVLNYVSSLFQKAMKWVPSKILMDGPKFDWSLFWHWDRPPLVESIARVRKEISKSTKFLFLFSSSRKSQNLVGKGNLICLTLMSMFVWFWVWNGFYGVGWWENCVYRVEKALGWFGSHERQPCFSFGIVLYLHDLSHGLYRLNCGVDKGWNNL